MPWIWYANRTLGRHLVMPGDCCSHWLGFASRIPLKWQHLFFLLHPSLLSFSLSLPFSCSEGCYVCNGCQNMVMQGSRRKERCRSFSLFIGSKKWCRFIFHSGLHDFRTMSHKRLRRKNMSENWSCLCATENGNCLYHSQTIERQMLLSGSSCGTFHTAICRRGTCWGWVCGANIKKKKKKKKKSPSRVAPKVLTELMFKNTGLSAFSTLFCSPNGQEQDHSGLQ